MSIITIISLSLTLMVVAASPGPGVFTTVATSLSSGFRPALALVAGIVAGHLLFLVLAVLGLSLVAEAMGEFFFGLKILGSLYLMWLGVKIWRSKPVAPGLDNGRTAQSFLGNGLRGLLVTLSNPKAILFYCGVFPAIIGIPTLNFATLAIVSAMVALIFSLVLTGYAYAAGRVRVLVSSETSVRKLNRTAGGIMFAAGAALIAKQ